MLDIYRRFCMKKVSIGFIFCIMFLSMFFVGCTDQFDMDKFTKNLSTYTMDITYNDDKTLSVNQTILYTNNTCTSLDNIMLHIYPNDFSENATTNTVVSSLNFDKAYYSGISYAGINFSKILVNDNDCNCSFKNDSKNILDIVFDTKLNANDKINIYFEYVITLPNVNHRFGFGENSINISNFYPIVSVYEDGGFDMDSYHYNGDPFYSDFANYYVSITVPKKYTLASSGNELEVVENNTSKCYKIEGLGIRDFAFVMSDKYSVVSSSINGVTVNYYYYNNSYPDMCLETSIKALDTFGELFGKYPYKTLNVCEASFVHGGMEYPNLVYISDAVLEKSDYLNVIVHEIAHQWWYGVVGNNQYKYRCPEKGR